MLATRQTVIVNSGIDSTWAYASDFERWAQIMPGYQSCRIEDTDTSLWVLKVGLGALVRTVQVRVHVQNWAGPERADFTFRLEGDPVVGSGCYLARRVGDDQTEMTLEVSIVGSGPMAPMWEAMGGPVLPKFALGFAEQLKERIEQESGAEGRTVVRDGSRYGLLARILRWLRSIISGGSDRLR